MKKVIILFALCLLHYCVIAQASSGTVVTRTLVSDALSNNLIELNNKRRVSVYLPPSYQNSDTKYPVIYYFHGFFWSDEKMFADGQVSTVFDRAISKGTVGEFILVAADFSSPTVGSFYENSPVSGMWLDFIHEELVPFIDNEFRTLANAQSRGLAGELIGGYGALKLAMLYPQTFSAVYALHPVATGLGYIPMVARPEWDKIHAASSFKNLQDNANIFSVIFTAMAQAYSPNINRPPLFADFMREPQNGKYMVDINHSETLRSNFLLDRLLPKYASNLRQMNGIKFDWGRYDENQDHVLSNQNFTRKLEEYGIEHFAEEYRGNTWDKNWIEDGRVETELLPFFNRYLTFASTPSK